MIKYSIAMGIRTLCVISLLFVQGWWMLIAVIAAVVLPYFAVVVANVSMRPSSEGPPPRPGAIVLVPRVNGDYRSDDAPGDYTSPAGHDDDLRGEAPRAS